jgi:predicted DsbA family dithiol-disulfide isomerase
MKDLFPGPDLSEKMAHMKQAADELGLPMGEREKTYNSRLAQELGKWAESKGRGEEFHSAVFRAYFVDGKNIGLVNELINLVKSLDLPAEEARQVLEARSLREAVDREWSYCREIGVTSVPTFVMNQQGVVGAQPYEVLEELMKINNIRKRGPSQ